MTPTKTTPSLAINEAASLHDFQKAIASFLQNNGLSPYAVEVASDRWIDVLSDDVFSCLLLPYSTLVSENGVVPPPLLEELKRLATKIDVMFIRDRDIQVPAAFGYVIEAPAEPSAQEGVLKREFQERVRSRGYHLNRILIVAPALDGPVAAAMLSLRPLYSRPFLVAGFPASLPSIQEFVTQGWLPVPDASGNSLRGPDAVLRLARSILFAQRINVRETSTLVSNPNDDDGLLVRLSAISAQAKENLRVGKASLCAQYPHLENIEIFDHKSGAVSFEPEAWRKLVARVGSEPILRYFTERLIGYWQQGHPCHKRVLYTPTKVILRGEAYYVHMKNIAPTDRLRDMCKEVEQLRRAGETLKRVSNPTSDPELWKACLGFLDHLRHIGLLLFSFAHAVDRMLAVEKKRGDADLKMICKLESGVGTLYKGETNLHTLCADALHTYYHWLLGNLPASRDKFDVTADAMAARIPALRQLCDDLDQWFANQKKFVSDRMVSELVRRWREADHPGDNLLVSHMVVKDLGADSRSVAAVGIGWGGIELPLVLQFLASLEGRAVEPYVATWSHYRNELEPVTWISIRDGSVAAYRPKEVNVLMDDNVLTGTTLEKVRNEMHLAGANAVSMFVTRFSGERRLAHMQMENLGVIDPDFMARHVGGFFAETAFSRSWSTKKGEYTSQIGVFSLGRRRILECIHNNSTVEAWDREGF